MGPSLYWAPHFPFAQNQTAPVMYNSILTESVELAALPACAMLVMSLLVLKVKVPTIIVAALQHLAAGIVLSAVAVELLPVLNHAPADQTWAVIVGFLSGIFAFLGLGYFVGLLEDDEDEEDEGEENPSSQAANPGFYHSIDSTRMSRSFSASDIPPGWNADHRPGPGNGKIHKSKISQARMWDRQHSNVAKSPLSKPINEQNDSLATSPKKSTPPFPLMFAAAVAIDALVDGFLIGVSLSAGEKGGLVMAIALSIEMAFLGMTFASAMRVQPVYIGLPATLLPPIILILGGVMGALLSAQAGIGSWGNTLLVSFGVAALLYLVTEELLLEAHESLEHLGSDGGHVWWVDLCFFVGFLVSLCLQNIENRSGGGVAPGCP